MSYDHTSDTTVRVILDFNSTFTRSGSQVTGVSNVAASPQPYNAVPDTGTGVTLGTDGGGKKYLIFDGSSSLKIASSTGFDAEFATDYTVLMVFKCDPSGVQALWGKGTQITGITQSGRCRSFPASQFSYPINSSTPHSFAMSYRQTPGFENRTEFYVDGVPNLSDGIVATDAGSGSDFQIGADPYTAGTPSWLLNGDVLAVVVWNRVALPHEILAVDRYYRAAFSSPVALPETLTNLEYVVVVESNSLSDNFNPVSPPFVEQLATTLGVPNLTFFNLSSVGRQTEYMVTNYSNVTGPLVTALEALGVETVVLLFEGVNDLGAYSASVAAGHFSDYHALLPGGTKFVTATLPMNNRSSTSTLNTFNADVLALGYPTADLGSDATIGVANIANLTTYFPDGTHWSQGGITPALPLFAGAIEGVVSPTAATPTFSPAAGTYTGTQSVTISTTTGGATIRYTTDGTDPTESHGSVYSSAVSVAANTTLKAIAYEGGFTDSTIGSAAYTINCATPTFSPAAGTYNSNQSVTVSTATGGSTIRYTVDGSTPTESHGTVYTGAVSVSTSETLKAIAYQSGFGDSAVGSAAYTLQAATPAYSPAPGSYSGTQSVTITSATSGVTIRFTTDGTTPSESAGTVYTGAVSVGVTETLKAIAYLSGYSDSSVVSGSYTITTTTDATPTFSPVAGTYVGTQSVTILSSTSGVTIRYTVDGSSPTESHGSVYSAAVSVATSQTLKAIAYKSGDIDSPIGSASYTVIPLPPVFHVPINNAGSVLATPHVANDGLLAVASTAPFGSPSTGSPIRVTCGNSVFSVTGISDGKLVIGGMLEGTTDANLPAGTVAEIRCTAGDLTDLQSSISTLWSLVTALIQG